MDKRKQVKDTSEKLLRRIINFINDSGIEYDECSSIMYELSASLFTCATISQDDEVGDVERAADNINWLANATISAIFDFYNGDLNYIKVGEEEDD